jgi:hypothetical protein
MKKRQMDILATGQRSNASHLSVKTETLGPRSVGRRGTVCMSHYDHAEII